MERLHLQNGDGLYLSIIYYYHFPFCLFVSRPGRLLYSKRSNKNISSRFRFLSFLISFILIYLFLRWCNKRPFLYPNPPPFPPVHAPKCLNMVIIECEADWRSRSGGSAGDCESTTGRFIVDSRRQSARCDRGADWIRLASTSQWKPWDFIG